MYFKISSHQIVNTFEYLMLGFRRTGIKGKLFSFLFTRKLLQEKIKLEIIFNHSMKLPV
jgi:hypothetical protein